MTALASSRYHQPRNGFFASLHCTMISQACIGARVQNHAAQQAASMKCNGAMNSDSSETSSTDTSDDSQDEEAISARRFAVDIVALTQEWGHADSDLSEGAMSPACQGRHTRYRNMALALEAAERRLSTRTRSQLFLGPVCFESPRVQAFSSFVIFLTTNTRTMVNAAVVDHYINRKGIEAFEESTWKLDSLAKDAWYFIFLAMDISFMLFQVACVRRDRRMAQLCQRLWQEGAYIRLIAFNIYAIILLGICSGWQLVRGYRQLSNQGYRDSFLLELGDPSMADSGAFRMPFYSSHLTFFYEMPFMLRICHFLSRDTLSSFDLIVCVAAGGSFALVLFALLTLDYGVSSTLVSQYQTKQRCPFSVVHALLRGTEMITRTLVVTSTMLVTSCQLFGHWLFIAALSDWVIGLLLLSWASKGFSKRALFLSIPLFGSNIALFADLPSLSARARALTICLDVLRSLEMGPAIYFYLLEHSAIQSGQLKGNTGFQIRVLGLLGLYQKAFLRPEVFAKSPIPRPKPGPLPSPVRCLVAMILAWCVHMQLRCFLAAGGLRTVAKDTEPGKLETAGSFDDAVFGSSLDEAYFYQDGAVNLAGWLFSKGIGDQFASLLEICWERQPLRLSRLEALAKLGEGGFGRVYKVCDTRRGVEYALKLQVRSRVATAAVREANALHEVKHPYVVELVQVFCTSSFYCILLELCEVDLNRYILDCQNAFGVAEGLPERDSGRFLGCIYLALQHLHDREIVFCDLKPENILIRTVRKPAELNVAKLADFGLAKSIDKLAQSSASLCGRFSGTPAFLPPEGPFTSESQVDVPQSPSAVLHQLVTRDWYALGCVLFLMLFGEVGGRKVRYAVRAILLPPPCDVIAAVISDALTAGTHNQSALQLNKSLLAPLPERGGGEDVRRSAFLVQSLPVLEKMVADFSYARRDRYGG